MCQMPWYLGASHSWTLRACLGIALHLPMRYFKTKGEMQINQCGNHLCDTTDISGKSDAHTGAHVDLTSQLGLLCTYYNQPWKTMKQLTKGISSRSFSKQQKSLQYSQHKELGSAICCTVIITVHYQVITYTLWLATTHLPPYVCRMIYICGKPAVMVLYVTSHCDNTVRKFLSNLHVPYCN